MARILMATLGSYGDLHPYLAMARVLKANGDDITIVTHSDYRAQVERIGVAFVPMKPGLDDIGPQETWSSKANSSVGGPRFIIRTLVMPYLEDSYQVIKSVAPGHDLIISHVLTFAAPLVADELGIPWISSILQPSTFFSAYDPPAVGFFTILPKLKFFGPSLTKRILGLMALATRGWLKPIKSLRAKIGLPPSARNELTEGCSPLGTLALFPSSFASPQPDWPANVSQVGFPLFDEETTADVSEGLAQFLKMGDPPIVFTLGTALVMMETSYYEVAYQAAKALRRRAVLLVGKKPRRIPEAARNDLDIFVSEYEPFSGLFPHAAAIVHQCGVGTTAQALASGRPQVLVPFAHDQPDNARRVTELGIGQTVPAGRLNVSRLVAALNEVITNEMYAQRASDFAGTLNRGNFGQQLIAAVSGYLARRRIPAGVS